MEKIIVDGNEVGMVQLDRIFEEAASIGSVGDGLRTDLLKLASIYNYIPSSKREQYADALLAAYGVGEVRQ